MVFVSVMNSIYSLILPMLAGSASVDINYEFLFWVYLL